MRVYAVYEGDELLAVGTAPELSELLGCTVQLIYKYAKGKVKTRHAEPVSDDSELGRLHADALNETCARIVRRTLGRCRDSRQGCDGLGWCRACYRAACRLASESKTK